MRGARQSRRIPFGSLRRGTDGSSSRSASEESGHGMEPWQIVSVAIGAAILFGQMLRNRNEAQSGVRSASEGELASETEVWIELDVEPLFQSSEPVSRDYLLDVNDSSEL